MEARIIMGYPCAGKTTFTQEYLDKGYTRINRDTLGGSLDGLCLQKLETALKANTSSIVLDNTYVNVKSREKTIAMCKKYKVPINCMLMDTSIEDAQVNFCMRMIQKYGKILGPEEITNSKDVSMLPPVAFFGYRKNFEEPKTNEGFDKVEVIKFVRKNNSYKNKALILDYDGCLRKTKSGNKFPIDPSDVEILPNRKEILQKFSKSDFYFLGASNQSGIAKGDLTYAQAEACFKKTNELLKLDIELGFCPHRIPPISCYCRKPMPGLAINWIEKYTLDKTKVCVIGDMTTDKTFSKRAGVNFMHCDEFFEDGWKKVLNY